MQANDTFWPRGNRSDLIYIECRGVRCQQGTWLTDLVELAEDRLLQLHVFEHGLDDHVALGEVTHVG